MTCFVPNGKEAKEHQEWLSGQPYWLGSARSGKWYMKERKTFATEKEALDWAREVEAQIQKYGARADGPREKVVMADA